MNKNHHHSLGFVRLTNCLLNPMNLPFKTSIALGCKILFWFHQIIDKVVILSV